MSKNNLSPRRFCASHAKCLHLSRPCAMSGKKTECSTRGRDIPLRPLHHCRVSCLAAQPHRRTLLFAAAAPGHGGTATTTLVSAGMGRGSARGDQRSACVGRWGHRGHSPSEQSDFNAPEERVALLYHQPGIAGAIHGQPDPGCDVHFHRDVQQTQEAVQGDGAELQRSSPFLGQERALSPRTPRGTSQTYLLPLRATRV